MFVIKFNNMKSFLKILYLYIGYLLKKTIYRGIVVFNGFAIIYAHKGAKIIFSKEGGIVINSSFISNLVGIYQRTILSCRCGGIINIGANVGISGSTIYALDSITIEDNVFIGANCKIIDNDFHPLDPIKRINQIDNDIKRAPIYIGKNSFIGMNSIILKGTTLGENCIVGAGSVVSGNFPDNVVIAGNPARILKYKDNE